MESKFKTTTAFEKICQLEKDVRIIQGGKGSSKTVSILMLFILLCISKREDLILSVVAESLPNLKSGALRDFEKILKSWGLFGQFHINKTDRVYSFTREVYDDDGNHLRTNTNVIEFFSVDGEASRLGSRRTHLYINEADQIKFSTYIELYGRTSGFTIMDYNPRRKFWAHKELIGEDHVDFLILNFSHNECIPEKELKSILWFRKKAKEGSKYFKNKWRVLGLGLLGITEGVIFENWEKGSKVPEGATFLGTVIDWGFHPDPATITKIYKWNKKIILEEVLYQRGLINSQIAKRIIADKENLSKVVIADNSEPKSIKELSTYGIPIVGVKDKSILSGLDLMQEYDFVLIGKNIVEEWENYCYKQNKSGESLGVPVDDWNHTIDPVRYYFNDNMGRANTRGNGLRFS